MMCILKSSQVKIVAAYKKNRNDILLIQVNVRKGAYRKKITFQ